MNDVRARVVTEKSKDGQTKITVLDPHTGKVGHEYHTPTGNKDVQAIKDCLERKGIHTDVIERS